MVVIPGSELLAATLNVVSQSLQIPVIIFLLIFAIFPKSRLFIPLSINNFHNLL